MKNLIYALALLFFITTFMNSCGNEEEATERTPTIVEARIEYTGHPIQDGCGYVLVVGQESYHPLDLNELFKVDDLNVLVEYITTDNPGPNCWFHSIVEIVSIELN